MNILKTVFIDNQKRLEKKKAEIPRAALMIYSGFLLTLSKGMIYYGQNHFNHR